MSQDHCKLKAPAQANPDEDCPVSRVFANLSQSDPWLAIEQARRRLKSHLPPTPLLPGRPLPNTHLSVYYKCDHMRRTGAYKERGGLNALLCLEPEVAKRGVIAASAGNHAQALAHHGGRLKIPVTVVMPTNAPLNKVESCRAFGAEVLQRGADFGEAKAYAMAVAKERGLRYVNGYDDPEIISGAGTCGLEILHQLPNVDVIVVPVGGGGLAAGVALAVKRMNPSVRIIGVESERCPGMTRALHAGHPVHTPVAAGGTIADGLAVPVVGSNTFELVKRFVDEVVTVPESLIAVAVLHLLEKEKMLLEGAGATGLAAVLSGKLDEALDGKNVVVVLSGGNIDMTLLGRLISRGLYSSGRLMQFDCAISDSVGGLAKFARCLAEAGAVVKDIVQENPYISHISVVSVHVTVEVHSSIHWKAVEEHLRKNGFSPKVVEDEKYADIDLAKL